MARLSRSVLRVAFSCILVQCSVVVGQYGGPDDFMKPKKCNQFKCGGGKFSVQKRPMTLTSTGCDSGGGMMMMNMGGKDDQDIEPCCHQRHACYAICGASKFKCDGAYDQCTKERCATQHVGNEEAQKKCDSNVNLQSMMANMNGCRNFDDAQGRACDCVSAESHAHKRRKQTLSDFYKKHNKDKIDDVEKLYKKHGTSTASKFAKLMTKVVSKYPKAVKIVRSSQQDMYENLMKDYDKDGAKTAKPGADANPPPPPTTTTYTTGGGGGDDGGDDDEAVEVDAESEFEHDEM